MAISTALWTTRLPALFIRRFLSSLSCPVSVFGMGKILGFSAKLVRLNFLFVEPFGRPGGRLVGVMYFCPQRGSYVGGSHAAGSKVQLSNNTKNLYGANPFPPTRLRTVRPDRGKAGVTRFDFPSPPRNRTEQSSCVLASIPRRRPQYRKKRPRSQNPGLNILNRRIA